ncbi:hypothetical protein BGZ81_004054, partial [Podila clonocystis]
KRAEINAVVDTIRAASTPLPGSSSGNATQEALLHNDLARTLAVVLKPAKPEPYTGLIDADACLNFIDNQAEYFEVVALNKDQWVKYTALALKGDAKTWWRNSGLLISTPWDIFSKAFIKAHTPPNAENQAMHDLDNIQQGTTTVAEYTLRFRRIARLVSDLSERMQVFKFLNGLHPKIRLEVKLRQPDSMTQAIHQATVIWSVVFQDGPPTTTKDSAMDIDNISMDINNFNHGNNTFRSGPRQFKPRMHTALAEGTERSRLTKMHACWWCRKPGHSYSDCRLYARHTNSISTSSKTGDDAGKALGE